MYIVNVSIFVKPESAGAFIAATMDNARNTRLESGNVRFDVLQAEDDPARFQLYEVYHCKADFVSHQTTEHYLRWKSAVGDMMAQPRASVKLNSVFFD